ncbi:MAG: lysostaphin resistance A-like protein, partial [Flavobacteriales bacterium]
MIHPAESDTVMGRQRISVQVMAFVGIAGVSMAVFSLIAVIIASGMYGLNILSVSAPNNLSDPDTVSALKFVQLFSSLGLFILPPLVFAFLASRKGYHYLCVDQPPALSSSLAVVLIMLFSLPAINWLAAMNAGMQFPDFLSGMEDWMRASEEQAAQLTEAFLKMDTGGDFLFNIFLIAIIPGIGEELLFRGVLQKLLIKWTKNRHAGIWITAILFS